MHAQKTAKVATKDIRKQFDIKLSNLEDGEHRYSYHLGQDFFDAFAYDEFEKPDIHVNVNLTKTGNLMKIQMDSRGHVELPDDRTGEPYTQPLEGKLEFLLKYGEAYNDDNDEMIIIPFHAPFFNIAQQVYEMVALSVPMKHVDPSKPEPLFPEKGEETRLSDPRWEKLKKLLNDKSE